MASIINAATSGGLITTADTSGILQLQTAGTTAVTVDASQRAAFVAGTAALPAITTTGDTNTGIFFPAADTIGFAEGGAEAMRIDASGNMGLGVTPSPWGTFSVLQQANGSLASVGTQTQLMQNAYFDGSNWRYITSNGASRYGQDVFGGATHYWYYAASGTAGNTISWVQNMTMGSDGSLSLFSTTPSSTSSGWKLQKGGNQVYTQISHGTQTTTAEYFYFINGNGTVGSIASNGSSTSFNTSSDYRLKNTIAPMTGALAKVALLKPVTYKWNCDNSDGQGFIAHELAEVVPQCVSGEKDGTRIEQYEISPAVAATFNEDGSQLTAAVEAVMGEREVPNYQGIDVSFLVATLTAAIQEQQALIETLTQRITALEGA